MCAYFFLLGLCLRAFHMTLTCSTTLVSSSKLRRARAAATKQKLYEAAVKCDSLMLVQSQLAMLTIAVNAVTMQMYAMRSVSSYVNLEPEDPAGAHDLTRRECLSARKVHPGVGEIASMQTEIIYVSDDADVPAVCSHDGQDDASASEVSLETSDTESAGEEPVPIAVLLKDTQEEFTRLTFALKHIIKDVEDAKSKKLNIEYISKDALLRVVELQQEYVAYEVRLDSLNGRYLEVRQQANDAIRSCRHTASEISSVTETLHPLKEALDFLGAEGRTFNDMMNSWKETLEQSS